MTPEEAARRLATFARVLDDELRDAAAALGDEALEWARRYSSGMLSGADLRRMGHPYARRHGQVRGADPATVNFQSGQFLLSWEQEGPRPLPGGGWEALVWNRDPKAAWLEHGTRTMLPRLLPEAVLARLEPRALAAVERAIERAVEAMTAP